MNPAERNKYKIINNGQIADGIFELIIDAPGIAEAATPGQFVNIYLPGGAMLLPRPISIASVDKSTGQVSLIYATVGEGTKVLSSLNPDPGQSPGNQNDNTIEAMGPLGSGFFDYTKEIISGKVILIGGGVGVPPLLFAAQRLRETAGSAVEIKAMLGYRAAPWLTNRFTQVCDDVRTISENLQAQSPSVATPQNTIPNNPRASGSYAANKKGTVIDLLNMMSAELSGAEATPASDAGPEARSKTLALACGPKPMLKAVAEWCGQNDIDLRISLEERMGCGYGACAGCTTKTRSLDDHDKPQAGPKNAGEDGIIKKKICVHGPVFWADEVVW